MSLGSPQFLLLIPLLVFVGWMWRPLELHRPLRALLLILLVISICDPQLRLKRGGMDLWVLIDRSDSARDIVDRREREWRSLLEQSKPGADYRLSYLDYAGEVSLSAASETEIYAGDRNQTLTALAIRDALARMDSDKHNRLLVFTDGYSTEPLTGIAERLLTEGIPLDYRELRPRELTDFKVSQLNSPSRIQIGEPFVIDVAISGTTDTEVPLTVFRNGRELFSRVVTLENGHSRFRFSDRISSPGSHRYEAVVESEIDAHPGNNRRERWVEVTSGPRILLVSNFPEDPIANVLSDQGYSIHHVDDPLSLSSGSLSGAKAVIINNVPAYELPYDFLSALDFFVKEQGGGLLMAGGEKSFGSGGYYQSPIDPLLPITMELKSEHRKLAVAMAIVMDRSGSMNMTTPSGHSKMQLANEGAARAVELLGDADAVTVFAVDSQAHTVAGLLNVGANRDELLSRIRRIESMGGGIFVYEGMSAAWEQLQEAETGQRHMILFSDATDTEEPGGYKRLLQEMSDSETTVSVIGLGSTSDPDADLLKDIAHRGNGRSFFTSIPGEIPNIFAQETVTVARSTFIDEPVSTQSTGRWYEFAQSDLQWPYQIDGYNLSYLREGDEAALISADSYTAPLVAFGRRGIGKTAAVSFPLGGDFSASVRSWGEYGDFIQTLTRWLIGDTSPTGIGVKHKIEGNRLTIDLFYDIEEWSSRFATSPPELALQRGVSPGSPEFPTWERVAPGHYSISTSLEANEPVRGAIKLSGAALPFGPIVAGGSPEWSFDSSRLAELRETARTTGGAEILDLTDAWKKPSSPGFKSVMHWFLLAALTSLLLEAYATRAGWRLPVLPAPRRPKRNQARSRKEPEAGSIPSPKEANTEAAPKSNSERAHRKSRFSRAKKRL